MISELSPACVVRDRHAQSGERLEFDQDDKERKSDRLHCDWEPPGRGRHHREAATCGSAGVLTLSQGSFHAQHTGLYVQSCALGRILTCDCRWGRCDTACTSPSREAPEEGAPFPAGDSVVCMCFSYSEVLSRQLQCVYVELELFCREDLQSEHDGKHSMASRIRAW